MYIAGVIISFIWVYSQQRRWFKYNRAEALLCAFFASILSWLMVGVCAVHENQSKG